MIAGMDEAGRGPAIGPLVFGIVVATEKELSQLEDAGIDDSKKLSKKKREKFASIIKSTVSNFGTLVVSAQEIDNNMDKMSLNQIEVEGFQKLLKPYAKSVTQLQLDAADVNAKRFGTHFSNMIDGTIDSRHKGDSIFVSVGAASILAKLKRDQIIEELQVSINKTDPDLPSFGSGYPVQAKPFLEAYVSKYNSLPKIARHSWKTSKDAMEKYGTIQSALDDFL